MRSRRTLLLCLAFWCLSSFGAERLALQIAGGYTDFEGFVEHPGTLHPVVLNPFDPGEVLELPPAEVRLPLQYDDDDVGWEATLSYRAWRNLHVTAGYGDLGTFDSRIGVFGVARPIVVRPPFLVRPPNPFTPRPPVFLDAPPAGIIANEVSLDTEAWLLGVKVMHALSDRADVYARLSGLRASFDVDTLVRRPFDLDDPDDRTGWAWGVGAQYQVFPRVSVGVAFSQYDVKLMKLDSYQLTLAFDLL